MGARDTQATLYIMPDHMITMETFFARFLWTDLAYSLMDCEDVNGDVIMMYVGAGMDPEFLLG